MIYPRYILQPLSSSSLFHGAEGC